MNLKLNILNQQMSLDIRENRLARLIPILEKLELIKQKIPDQLFLTYCNLFKAILDNDDMEKIYRLSAEADLLMDEFVIRRNLKGY